MMKRKTPDSVVEEREPKRRCNSHVLYHDKRIPQDLDVLYEPKFLTQQASSALWDALTSDGILWHRVFYKSRRFAVDCETPCWTNCFGGVKGAPYYQPMPGFLQSLKRTLEEHLNTHFNVVLIRLYATGSDEIAWHTDARQWLGRVCNVASISLGATRRFEFKRVIGPLWPEIHKRTIEANDCEPSNPRLCGNSEVVPFDLKDGDLLVMRGLTQQKFYHRLAPKKRTTMPRININFRYIRPENMAAARTGHDTYYKYCVTGDDVCGFAEKAKTYKQIIRLINAPASKSIKSFFKSGH